MDKKEYDVFISYSRKDYVDEKKRIIPGNVVSQIKHSLDENGISYWMDEKGIYSGDEFAKIIAGYIRRSKIFLFISTENSNSSEWTSDEIATARTYRKKIIPFKYDDSFYNEDVILFIAKLDFIDYYVNPTQAYDKLIASIKKYLNELEEAKRREEELQLQKQREEEERKRKQEEEAKKKEVKEEISQKANACQMLIAQQDALVKLLVNKNIFIGNESKKCPICGNLHALSKTFCDHCGWQFPAFYSLYGEDSLLCDETQKTRANLIYQSLKDMPELIKSKKDLEGKYNKLQKTFETISRECTSYQEEIKNKNAELLSFNDKFESMAQKLDDCQKNNTKITQNAKDLDKNYKLKLEECNKLIETLKSEKESLKERVSQFTKEIEKLEAQIVGRDQLIRDLESQLNLSGPLLNHTNEEVSKDLPSAIYSEDDAFKIVKEFCTNANIKLNSSVFIADIKYDKLSKILKEMYNIDLSVYKLKIYSTISDLTQTIWNMSGSQNQ